MCSKLKNIVVTYRANSSGLPQLVYLLWGEIIKLHAHRHIHVGGLHVRLESLLSHQGLSRLLMLEELLLLLPHRD